tara:strand:+ start:4192 stop:4647 length:456 start_codon:yes stop_codon:yes gene_type:complete
MPSHDNEKVIAVLSCFRKQAELSKPAQNDERVWDRVERLAELSRVQGHTNTSTQQRLETWESAVNALLQYIDNEWPIEKHNKVRADNIAEIAATLFAKGATCFPQSQKSTELQSKVIDAFEEQDLHCALNNYRHQTMAIINASFAQPQIAP